MASHAGHRNAPRRKKLGGGGASSGAPQHRRRSALQLGGGAKRLLAACQSTRPASALVDAELASFHGARRRVDSASKLFSAHRARGERGKSGLRRRRRSVFNLVARATVRLAERAWAKDKCFDVARAPRRRCRRRAAPRKNLSGQPSSPRAGRRRTRGRRLGLRLIPDPSVKGASFRASVGPRNRLGPRLIGHFQALRRRPWPGRPWPGSTAQPPFPAAALVRVFLHPRRACSGGGVRSDAGTRGRAGARLALRCSSFGIRLAHARRCAVGISHLGAERFSALTFDQRRGLHGKPRKGDLTQPRGAEVRVASCFV